MDDGRWRRSAEHDTERAFSRRQALLRTAVGMGAVWAAPVVTVTRAFAEVGTDPPIRTTTTTEPPPSTTSVPSRLIDVEGTATGTTEVVGSCPSIGPHAISTGSFATTGLGSGTYAIDACLALSDPTDFPADGTFELVTNAGNLIGTFHSQNGFSGGVVNVDADLAIAGGTGDYANAGGALQFEGTSTPTTSGNFDDAFTVSGTVAIPI